MDYWDSDYHKMLNLCITGRFNSVLLHLNKHIYVATNRDPAVVFQTDTSLSDGVELKCWY